MLDLPDHMPGFFEVHSTYAQKIHDLGGLHSLCLMSRSATLRTSKRVVPEVMQSCFSRS